MKREAAQQTGICQCVGAPMRADPVSDGGRADIMYGRDPDLSCY